ncbi:MAG: translocation/assembly module TamB domain-containing protein [Candidatus Hydrogenedentes bacterium]|nr:translocation/assembly module TamB domain-containing protein [Candidatus Hydrogenedentota bacterium]
MTDDATRKKRWPKRRAMALLALACLALAGLLFGALQTPPAKRFLAARLAETLSGALPWPVHMEGIGGVLPFSATVAAFHIGDAGDPWLEVADAGVALDLFPLLRGQVALDRVAAASVTLHRLPPPGPPEPEEPAGPLALPALRDLPGWLRVGRLQVERVALGAPVLGEALAMSLAGAYHPEANEAIQLDVRGLGGADLRLAARAALRDGAVLLRLEARDGVLAPVRAGLDGPLTAKVALEGPLESAAFSLDLDANASALLALKGTLGYTEPLAIQATGQATPPADRLPTSVRERFGSAFDISLDVALEDGQRVAAREVRVGFSGGDLTISGAFGTLDRALDALVAFDYDDFHRLTGQPLEGDPVALAARIPLGGALDRIAIQPELTAGGAPLLSGALDIALADGVTATGALRAHPAVPGTPAAIADLLSEGAGLDIDVRYANGEATFTETRLTAAPASLRVNGTVAPETGVLALDVEAVAENLNAFEQLAGFPLAGRLAANLALNGQDAGSSARGEIAVANVQVNTITAPEGVLELDISAGRFPDALAEQIEAVLSGRFPGFSPQPGLQRDLDLAGTLVLEDLRGLTVRGLDIQDGNLSLTGDGAVDLESRTADFQAGLKVAQIGDYAGAFGLPYRGGVDLQASVRSGESPGELLADLNGALNALDGLPAPAAGLLGKRATLSGQLAHAGEQLKLNAFKIEGGGGVTVEAAGDYRLDERQLQARASGRIADLGPLSGVAGRPLSGGATFTLEAGGPVDRMAARASVSGTGLDLDVLMADTAEVTIDAAGIPSAIAGDVLVTLNRDGAVLSLRASGGHRGGLISIESLNLEAGGNRLRASGSFVPASARAGGEVELDAPALEGLQTWLNLPLSGSLLLSASLDRATGAFSGELNAHDLVLPGLTLGRAVGRADVANLREFAGADVNLDIEAVAASDIALDAAIIRAQGDRDALALTASGQGEFQDLTRFKVEAGGLFGAGAATFEISTLAFQLEDDAFAIEGPAVISWADGGASLGPLAIAGDAGRVEVSGRYAAGAVDVRAQWSDVSLGLLALAGIDPAGGAVSGALSVTGDPAAPEVSLDAVLHGYRAMLDDMDTPGLDARLMAEMGRGGVEAALEASVPDAARFDVRAALPLEFAISPWRFAIPEDAAWSGVLAGNADLAAVAPLFALEGHEIRGKLSAELRAGGAVFSPRLDGAVTITDGYYENGNTSTILNAIKASIEAQGDTLRLTEFHADDTAGGVYSADGYFALRPEERSPFEFHLRLDGPRLVYRDDLRAEGDGELHLVGDSGGASLTGNLSVGPAYLTIPEGSGETQITTVEYRVKGERAEEEEEEGSAAPAGYPIALDLALNLPGRIFLTGPGLDSEWSGNFRIRNTASEPGVEGILRVNKGTLDFLGRAFSLAESTITFDGQHPPSPYLRITAETETADVLARVRMEGLPESINITLESEPPMPQDEILARVLFGRRLSDVSPVQALTLARYASLFRGRQRGGSVLGRQGPQPFLVDRVSVRSGSGVGDMTIATGKYLSDDFYLEFEQGLGAAQSLVSLEWLFAPRWSLKARTTSQGEGGFGVFWKKDY